MERKIDMKVRKAVLSEKEKLTNMWQLYLHDLSMYTESLELNDEGRFDSSDVEVFFKKKSLHPYVIEKDKKIIGFIFLTESPYVPKGADYCIHDAFILRKYRGNGIGMQAVSKLFELYTGKFAMLQLIKNTPAITFWKKVLSEHDFEYTEKEIVEGNDICLLQEFYVPRR